MIVPETESPRARCSTKPKFYLTAREAARVLRVSIHTIRSYCRRELLTAYTDDGHRMLISSRELITKMREYERLYYRYRRAMRNCGWINISKAESNALAYGTKCTVNVHGNKWQYWYNPNSDTEPPDVNFYRRVTFIVPLEGEETAA